MRTPAAPSTKVPARPADTVCIQLRNPASHIVLTDETPDDPPARFLARITEDIARGPINLPCLPDIVPQVRRALDDPTTSTDDLVRIAGSEPRLSARLIQTAGSVVLNPSGRPPPNLRAAVTPLGQLWEKSITVGSICQTLAREMHVPPDEVFLAGLVHGIGHFYMLVRSVEEGSEVTYDQLPTGLIDARHPAIGRAVLAKWGFEPGACEAVLRKWVRKLEVHREQASPVSGRMRRDDAEVARLRREFAKTKAERDILQESQCLLRGGSAVRFEFMAKHRLCWLDLDRF